MSISPLGSIHLDLEGSCSPIVEGPLLWARLSGGDEMSRDVLMAEVVSQLVCAYEGLQQLVGSAYSMPASFDVAASGLAVVVELLDHCCERVWVSDTDLSVRTRCIR